MMIIARENKITFNDPKTNVSRASTQSFMMVQTYFYRNQASGMNGMLRYTQFMCLLNVIVNFVVQYILTLSVFFLFKYFYFVLK